MFGWRCRSSITRTARLPGSGLNLSPQIRAWHFPDSRNSEYCGCSPNPVVTGKHPLTLRGKHGRYTTDGQKIPGWSFFTRNRARLKPGFVKRRNRSIPKQRPGRWGTAGCWHSQRNWGRRWSPSIAHCLSLPETGLRCGDAAVSVDTGVRWARMISCRFRHEN